ncbi:MAG TPA: hypothetical protein DEB40_02615 [Elusimicrobia bacterium]|nr:hypothetical protein [Elusimicrobiota bacterium]HBT60623.1 hypothetical protein [Elusimicrobiota bacterium]
MPDRPKRILIVDDEPDLLRLLSLFIGSKGWDVVAVTNGQEALGVFEAGKFDVLLADVDLDDEVDGIFVAKTLLSSDPNLKIVMMSGKPHNAQKVREANLGAFMSKPFEFPQIGSLLCLG